MSVALACRRMKGSHTAEQVNNIILMIHDEYKINNLTILATVTDNASNFCKAFREFGIDKRNLSASEEDGSDEDIEKDISCKTSGILKCLPKHTLNLCATTDINKTIKQDAVLNNIHDRVLGKCNKVWKALNRPKESEMLQDLLKLVPSRPVETRWNSLFDAFIDILKIKGNGDRAFEILEIRHCLIETEFLYIEKFVTITTPLADSLDILQGEVSAKGEIAAIEK
ncbi:unnamed protein product [Brassicogethes aeneus]|uniref:Uncharacterized protein n=1 Tax=Brassicogethes aeneus TaxID=1431903 RepID=A0A9P0BAY6_BRAAE|nr:unnamed protein product [Brassicogethes aeneus]